MTANDLIFTPPVPQITPKDVYGTTNFCAVAIEACLASMNLVGFRYPKEGEKYLGVSYTLLIRGSIAEAGPRLIFESRPTAAQILSV